MKVIICGAGQVGSSIARQLSQEGNAVSVIDQNADLIRDLTDELDVQGFVGHGAYPDVLDRAGIADADMIIAVTYADEVNMVACQVAHSLFKVPLKIARVRAQNYLDPVWADLFTGQHLPIDVIISPELEVARSVLRRISAPGSFEVIDLADGLVQVVGVHLPDDCPVVNTPLRQLTELFPDLEMTVLAVVRQGKLTIPASTDQLMIGDDVYFSQPRANVPRGLDMFGLHQREARRVVVVGGGNIGLYVAKELESGPRATQVRMIEANKVRAEYAADQLSRSVIFHGDGLAQEILREAGVPEAEVVVALTNDDEVNVLVSVVAKLRGARRAMALVNSTNYDQLAPSLGVDAFINPRAITVSTILQHVRRGRIKSLHALEQSSAEVIEAEILETSSLVGKTLREARLPDGIKVGAIVRGDAYIYPRGDTLIELKDRVVALVRQDAIRKIEPLFRVSLDYF